MKVLGIDPGYAIVGWGLVTQVSGKMTVENCGAITTPADMPFQQRLERIYDELSLIIATTHPDTMSIEQLFFTTNQKTVIAVSQARGVLLLAAIKAGISIFEYTPLQVKQAVVGYGKAEKLQVMEMTKRMLRLSELPKPDDVADALAIAICHLTTSGSLLSSGRQISTNPKKVNAGYTSAILERNPQLLQVLKERPKPFKVKER